MPDPFDTPPTHTIDVDARLMQPPEPFEHTVEALDRLQPGGEVRLLIPREPNPLFQMLRNSGYRYRSQQQEDGMWLVRIRLA